MKSTTICDVSRYFICCHLGEAACKWELLASSDARACMQPKGSSFEGNDKGYLKLKLGESKIIPAVDEALRGMKTGGVRRLIIPEQLGYPEGDYKNWEPSPGTFSVRSVLHASSRIMLHRESCSLANEFMQTKNCRSTLTPAQPQIPTAKYHGLRVYLSAQTSSPQQTAELGLSRSVEDAIAC
jgi:hypothetical protein